MEKGYYFERIELLIIKAWSQSTIKMEKGYYEEREFDEKLTGIVSIHNKNGKGLLQEDFNKANPEPESLNPQ